jgi:hypothetical protein
MAQRRICTISKSVVLDVSDYTWFSERYQSVSLEALRTDKGREREKKGEKKR